MRPLLILSLLLLPGLLLAANRHAEVVDDNDFAEFEESDDGQSTSIHYFVVVHCFSGWKCIEYQQPVFCAA